MRADQRRREKACQMAAQVMAGRPDEEVVPLLWSLTVFFESYMARGCTWTQKNFGPKKPVKLKIAAKGDSK
jgi:hypothetical protein